MQERRAGKASLLISNAKQNTSKYEFYYIAAYQWNGNGWQLDTTSSVFGDSKGGIINNLPEFQKLKVEAPVIYTEIVQVTGPRSPYPDGPSDWQVKYAPRTASTNTQGLGPLGFMFVLSAKSVNWMTFYSLPQITLNRGPENQFSPPGFENCWYAELDFLEAPFWGGETRVYQLLEFILTSYSLVCSNNIPTHLTFRLVLSLEAASLWA